MGDQTEMRAEGDVIRFRRSDGAEQIFIAVNLSDRPAQVAGPGPGWRGIGSALGSAMPGPDGTITLEPWQSCLLAQRKDA